MRHRTRVVLAAILTASIAGCGDDPSGPETPEYPVVIVTASASQSRFSRQNPMMLTVTVENRSTSPVAFGYGSSTCWLGFETVREGAESNLGGGRPCSADYALQSLDAGESHTESFHLDGVLFDWPPPYGRIAAPGIYEIRGVIGDYSSQPIVVEYYIDP